MRKAPNTIISKVGATTTNSTKDAPLSFSQTREVENGVDKIDMKNAGM